MKNILLTTLVSIGIILSGCGSDESTEKSIKDKNITQEENSSTRINNLVDYSIPLQYNYNKDGSSFQELSPLYVNQYEEIENKLDSLRGDDERFNNYYEWYVGELISTQRGIDTHPSYAPRGKSKHLIVDVFNGKIDYSAYKLIGDIDENGEVDFDDEIFLKETIANGNMDSQHDLNGDNKVDTRDIINLIARMGTEIKSFDFYTTNGEKLNIDSRAFDDSRLFDYSGSESKVMVVAKDRNGVSGFTSGLSDIDTLWYVGLSIQKQQRVMQKEEGMEATNPARIRLVREALAFIDQTPPAYLLGWKISVKFSTADSTYLELDTHGLEDMDTSFFNPLEDKIKIHFKDTKMEKPIKKFLKKNRYLFHIGLGRYEKDEQVDGKYEFDLKVGSFDTHVKAYRKTVKNSHTINGNTVFTKNIVHISSVVFPSKADKKLEGTIQKDGNDVKGGVVTAKRIGPDPKDEKYEGKIEDSKYRLKDIPFGGYELKYISKCECEKLLDSSYVFKKEENKDFSIDKKEVKVKLTVRDNDNNLLKDKNVRIEPDECMVETDSFSDISDDNAKVEFKDVPVGKYKVYVDNKESGIIQVCDEFDGEALGEKLWDIDITHKGINSAHWSWKNIKIGLHDEPIATSSEFYSFLSNPNNKDKQPLFPYDLGSPIETMIVLTDTSAFRTNRYNESFEMRYQYNNYCIQYDFFINDDTRNMPTAYCRDSDFPIYNDLGYDGRLTNSEINSLRTYKGFTMVRHGSDPKGFVNGVFQKVPATLTIKFTPSK